MLGFHEQTISVDESAAILKCMDNCENVNIEKNEKLFPVECTFLGYEVMTNMVI
jgi:hypothetical protein